MLDGIFNFINNLILWSIIIMSIIAVIRFIVACCTGFRNEPLLLGWIVLGLILGVILLLIFNWLWGLLAFLGCAAFGGLGCGIPSSSGSGGGGGSSRSSYDSGSSYNSGSYDSGSSYRPSSSNVVGDRIYHNDGSHSERVGNTTYHSDGSHSERVGNTIYHSDGSHSDVVGDRIYHSDGTYTDIVGDNMYHYK